MAVLLAVLYNAILSVVNAHVFMVNNSIVVASEVLIVTACLGYIAMRIRALPNLFPPLIFFLAIFLGFIAVSIVNETLFVKGVRDVLLIITFFLMGGLISEKSLITAFKILGWLVLIFMVLENYATEIYAALFKPAFYYANTRGLEEYEFNELGLFNASLGYDNRFSYGFLSSHRLSSIFLEQVSMANFSMILCIFLSAFWTRLKKFDRCFFLTLIPLIILTNSSRTGSALSLIALIGFFVFPRLPRFLNIIYMPLIVMICYFFFYDPDILYDNFNDNLEGRIGRTSYFLHEMDLSYFTGGGLESINKTGDTGYAYLIYAFTVFGLIALWLFSALVVPQNTPEQKRYVHTANLFIFVNLLIGAAILSIKVAAPLWIMAGFMYYKFDKGTEYA